MILMKKSEETKRIIIEKVAPLFNKHGYEGTSLSDLTEAVGLTKGALYGNFRNKDEIAVAALKYNIKRISEEIAEKVSQKSDSCEKLVAMAQYYSDAFDRVTQSGGCPILNAAVDSDNSDLPLRDVVIKSLDYWIGSIKNIMGKGIKKGEIRKGLDVETFASFFVSLIEGGIMLSKVTGDRGHLDGNVSILKSKIMDELKI
jgi:TetR/AcrR family transcriptional regulator, transcriptional repressor for nem operon